MTTKKLSRRDFLTIAATAGGAAALGITGVQAAESASEPFAMPARQAAKTVYSWTQLQPTEWTQASAEHPLAYNGMRILAERLKEQRPDIDVQFVDVPVNNGVELATWLTARVASGDAPDLIFPWENTPVQRGWCLPLDDYLAQQNPFASQYTTWSDVFYPALMRTLVYLDGKTYTAPMSMRYPGVGVGMSYNKDLFAQMGLKPPTNWTEELEVAQALKDSGSGMSPWWNDFGGTKIDGWPFGIQILPVLLQDIGAELDTDGDKAVSAQEQLAALKAGLVGPSTEKYQTGIREYKKLADLFIPGWQSTNLEQLFREGQVALQLRGSWEFSQLANDPGVTFERGFLPLPPVTSADIPGATDPSRFTDGTVPADQIVAYPDTAILESATTAHDSLEATITWLQWITEPENNAFINNENQQWCSSAKDAPLGPLWQEISQIKVPILDYQAEWCALNLDSDYFNNWRKLFESWLTNQIDETTFFERFQQEADAVIARMETPASS